ncbi:MAG TPA: PAS domain S-box protein [Methanocella sp.]|uniref:PAS domain S-box protein n=1 Tax=Methanocella sp. TaxID=2052833 RepID=UPI002C979FE5|nr:PAS domain S-box protein [Methanocella sp.]HTY91865.1 PAS domain S-box protein [Methanocella sp.]
MKSDSTYCGEDAEDEERTIAKLKDRIHVLENELRLLQKDKDYQETVEHRQAEESLQLMRHMVDQAQDEASLISPDGRFYYVNDAKCRSLGYTREELLSMYVWDVGLDMTKDKFVAVWQDAKGYGFKKFEDWHRTKYGQVFQAEVSVTYFDFHGREYLCALTRDITERKRAEKALRESEEKFRLMADFTDDWEYWTDLRGNYIYVSPSCERITGHGPEEFYRDPGLMQKIVHPDDLAAYEQHINDHLTSPTGHSGIDFRIVAVSGEIRWISHNCLPVFGRNGGLLGRRASNRDITDRKRVEEALKLTQASVDLAANGIAWITPEGKIAYANEVTCKALQRSRDELQGMYVWDINSEYTRDKWQEQWMEIKERGSFTFEAIHYVKDGRELPVELSVNYIISDGREFDFAYIKDITERKQAEKALRESEEKYRELVENANSIILRMDKEGNIVYVNEFAERFFGYSVAELVGRNVLGTITPASDSAGIDHAALLQDLLQHPEEYRTNLNENVRKNGEPVWISWTNKAVYKDGDLAWLLCVGNDVTEQKRAEVAQQESDARLRLALDSADAGMWEWDLCTNRDVWSEELWRLYGLQPHCCEPSYAAWLSVIHPDDREMAGRTLREAAGKGIELNFEYRVLDGNGKVRWLMSRGRPLLDAGGRLVRYIGIVIDITDRKRAEEALRVSEEKFRALAEVSPSAIFIYQGDSIIYANPATLERTGFSMGELLSRNFLDMVHPDYREMVRRHRLARQRGEPVPSQYEVKYITKSGEERWAEFTPSNLQYQGMPAGIMTAYDITERKCMEKALQDALSNVERHVGELDALIASIADAMMVVDKDGNISYMNAEACRIFGYAPEDYHKPVAVRTKQLRACFTDGTPLKYEDMLSYRALRGETVNNLEMVFNRMDTSPIWIIVSAAPIKDSSGGIIGAVVTLVDNTRRKLAEEALQESRNKLEAVFVSMNDGVAIIDADQRVVSVNEAFARFHQFWDKESYFKTVREYGDFIELYTLDGKLIPLDDWPILRGLQGETASNIEVLIKRTDTGEQWYGNYSFAPILDNGGIIVGSVITMRDITERKRAEEALRVSEERLRQASSAGHIGLYEWNVDRDIFYFSPEAYGLYGCIPGTTLTYEKWLPVVHPDDRDMVERRFAENREIARRKLGFTSQIEYRVVHGGGAVLWLEVQSTYAQEGGDIIARGSVRDITERKRAEEALRVSEERLRQASSAGHIGLYEWNVDRDIFYFSPETYELYGSDADSPITFEKWIAAVHNEDRVAVERQIIESVENTRNGSDGSVRYEFRVVHPDGTVRWLEAVSTGYLEGGEVIARGAVRDITERKRADEALRISEEKFRVLADMSFGLIAVHSGSNLLYVNNQAVPFTGYTKDELLKMSFWELFTDDTRELIKKRAFDRLAGKPVLSNYEVKIITKDDKIKWVNMTAGLFLYEGKTAIITTMFDITDNKNAEKELKEAKAQSELYLDLMGHDINNFNMLARGYLELIDNMAEDEKLKQLVTKPMEAIDNSSRLIQNVQKLQRGKSGEYKREALDLGALVEEVAGQMGSTPDMHTYINCNVIKGVHVRADELLRDVFANLIGNAIKHSAESPHIDICMVPEEKDGRGYCKVIIDDNGPGVPDDMKEKIFNRLSRGNTKAKGSGLGLYLVKTLVDSYGGKVWVEDKVKGDHAKGARFVMELPVI